MGSNLLQDNVVDRDRLHSSISTTSNNRGMPTNNMDRQGTAITAVHRQPRIRATTTVAYSETQRPLRPTLAKGMIE